MHNKPNGNMNAAQLIALYADDTRHENAMFYEMSRCKPAVLAELSALEGNDISAMAAEELERRRGALQRLRIALA